MRIKPWGTLGALGLICALMVGCNNTPRQPDKVLGATTGNPPQGKSIASTGAPPVGTPNANKYPVVGGAPNNSPYNMTSGGGNANTIPQFNPPANNSFAPTPGGFVPPTPGGSPLGNGPLPTPNVTPQNPKYDFGSDRLPPTPPNPFQGVKMPGQP